RLVTTVSSGNPLAQGAVVRLVDPADPADPLVLGTIPESIGSFFGTATADVAGDLLIGQVEDGVAAFRLDTDGTPTSRFLAAAPEDEVTARQAADLCTGITPVSLDLLGYRETAGVPANCSFTQTSDLGTGGGGDFNLQVHAFALAADGDLSAEDVARATFANTADGDTAQDIDPFTPISGLGDEAAISSRGSTLVTRLDNAVVHLSLAYGPRKLAARRTALEAIARDLLAELARRRG
ncbi:MAG TPA: hypothetical protein VM575_07745, partial [Nocardioides sp.]|nr:hypothetical protein [Nocardioides sp.]